ncbi:hypothetical protein [Arthrobacter sp. ISL-69]|uniref:hypothetical protein n=1 Tax=Arthrobacter sp. ISL-69 TaxID=2819113 RepID=UPI001BE72CE4|nr:hypothetical protein [Arthrobacter sp. ISL-69]
MPVNSKHDDQLWESSVGLVLIVLAGFVVVGSTAGFAFEAKKIDTIAKRVSLQNRQSTD